MTTNKRDKNSSTPTPHDTLVREHFQHPQNALGLLKVGLPPTILAELKLDTLRHKGIHLSTSALLKSVTDLLFTCELQDGSDAFVHIILEHKSHPDALVAVQILKYMALIWDHYRRKNPNNIRLPFVIPLVFYHGQDNWEPRPLHTLFPKNSPLLAYIPRFDMSVCNLRKIPEATLRADILNNTMLLLMKALLGNAPARHIAHIIHIIHTTFSDADIRDALELFFNYLGQVRPEITLDAVEEELTTLSGDIDMSWTFKEQWAEYSYKKGLMSGEARGEVIGETKGLRGAVFELLGKQFTVVPVHLAEKLYRIQGTDVLRGLIPLTLEATSLEAFEAYVDKAIGIPHH